jgi:hypothetical protein
MILVASIHHTGTKTVFNDILREVEDKERIHIEPKFLEELKHWLKRATTIVPIRHPRTLAVGWKSRFKKLDELEEQIELLKTEIAPFNPFYLPIDNDDRDEWLNKVNLELKLNLTTNWPVIGRHGGDWLELSEDEERRVKTWMEDGFFAQFGYEA